MAAERSATLLAVGGALAAAGLFAASLVMGGAGARAWLGAAFLCAAVPAGAIGLSMTVRLIPGPWRDSLAPALAPALWPLVGAAAVMAPVLIAPGRLYPWVTHPAGGAFRETYLSQPFFLIRGAAWFVLLAWLGLRGAKGGGPMAAVGLLVYVPFSTLIAVDWLQSLHPEFSSSGFGLYVLSVQMGLALSLAVALAARGATERGRDVLGGVLFTGLALWAYLGFMQYLILWAGDLPAGVSWYRDRDGWAPLAWLAIGLKAGPGAALIFGHVRRNPRALAAIGLAAAAGAAPEIAWLTLPGGGPADLGLFAAAALAAGAMSLGLYRLGRARQGRTA